MNRDPLYALPLPLISHIKKHAPDVWTREDLAFEKDLSTTTHAGFFFCRSRCPVSY